MEKEGQERVQEFLHKGRVIAHVRTNLPATTNQVEVPGRCIKMLGQHVTWLQAEFEDLTRRQGELQEAYDKLKCENEAMKDKVEQLWMSPCMPGAVMAAVDFFQNANAQK